MTFDQEYRARIGGNRTIEPVRNALKLRRLIGRNFPRSGFEGDAVDVDARHALAHRAAVTDFVERITPLDPLDWRRHHGVVDQFRRRALGLDDIAIVRNPEHRRRQIDVEAANSARAAIAVVDNDDLAAPFIPANSAQQLTVAIVLGNDLRTIGTDHDGARVVADLLGPDVARAIAESIHLVVTDERLAARIADDDPPRLGNDRAATFLGFSSRALELIQAARPRCRSARRNRCQRLSRRRCCRNRRADRRRRTTHLRSGSWRQRSLASGARCGSCIRRSRSRARRTRSGVRSRTARGRSATRRGWRTRAGARGWWRSLSLRSGGGRRARCRRQWLCARRWWRRRWRRLSRRSSRGWRARCRRR